MENLNWCKFRYIALHITYQIMQLPFLYVFLSHHGRNMCVEIDNASDNEVLVFFSQTAERNFAPHRFPVLVHTFSAITVQFAILITEHIASVPMMYEPSNNAILQSLFRSLPIYHCSRGDAKLHPRKWKQQKMKHYTPQIVMAGKKYGHQKFSPHSHELFLLT